jgi:L-fucose isomerase-like protein
MELIKNHNNQIKNQNTCPRKLRKVSKNKKRTKNIKKNLRKMRSQKKKIIKNQRTQNTP